MSAPGYFATKAPPSVPYSKFLRQSLQSLDELYLSAPHDPKVIFQQNRSRAVNLPTHELVSRLGLRDFVSSTRSVHVTGSKGKGSVSSLIAHAFNQAPFTAPSKPDEAVGLFLTPHVERFTERIVVSGCTISDDTIALAIRDVIDARNEPTCLKNTIMYDVMTVAGFLAFQRAGVKRMVVEVVIGGRSDATNVISSSVCVITNIFLEHSDVIGPTVEDIAYEKSGVIRPGATVIVGMSADSRPSAVIAQEAEKLSPPATVVYIPQKLGEKIFSHNLRLARAAIEAVAFQEHLELEPEKLLSDLEARRVLTSMPARQEIFNLHDCNGRPVKVLLDGAHVPQSVESVLCDAGIGKAVFLLACNRDKDSDGICKVLAPATCAAVVTVAGESNDCTPTKELKSLLTRHGVPARDITEVRDPFAALDQALSEAAERSCDVVVIGTFLIAGCLRPFLVSKSKACNEKGWEC